MSHGAVPEAGLLALGRFRPPAATEGLVQGSCLGFDIDIVPREHDLSWQLGWAGYTSAA